MGSVSLDVEIQGFLSTGLDYVRAHPEVCDEIFDTWLQPHLEKLYGRRAIEQARKWLTDNDIPVVLSWGLQNAKLPCLSVHLAQDPERVESAALSDHAGFVGSEVAQPVIVPPFTPKAYDPDAGIVTVGRGISLNSTAIAPNHVMVDYKGEEYLVQSPITDTSFAIDTTGDPVDPRKLYVKAGPGMAIEQKRGGSARFLTHVDIGFHATTDHQTVLWLYYTVSWILFRFKLDMERRGIQLQTYAGSEFNKDSKFLAENVYSRWMRYSAQVSVEWTEPAGALMGGLNVTTHAEAEDGDDIDLTLEP